MSNGHGSGRQFVADATQLSPIIGEGAYDAILSSHVIEHLANPLRALGEWNRVLRRGGWIIVVAPEGARTFDHARDPTPLAHFMVDLRNGVGEDDLGHLPEILRTHDLAMDPGAGSFEEFAARSRRNLEFRALHHHVFTLQTLPALLESGGFSVEGVTRVPPAHLLVWGHKNGRDPLWAPRG